MDRIRDDPSVDKVYYDEISSQNDSLSPEDTVVGCSLDWRHEPATNRYFVMRYSYWIFERMEDEYGIKMYWLHPTIESNYHIVSRLDGYMIGGGRDIDPKYYGQENTHSQVHKEDSERRWNLSKYMVDHLHRRIPIFGICYGLQVLNCLFGGDLCQDLENGYKNHFRQNKMTLTAGSRLDCILKEERLIGNCYHHQGLDRIADCMKVTAVDEKDGYPHAIEFDGPERDILAVLWHPEATFKDTRMEETDRSNHMIFVDFFSRCNEFRLSGRKIEQTK